MNSLIKLFITSLILSFFLACGNTTEEDENIQKMEETTSNTSVSANAVDDTIAKQIMDMWGMHGESSEDLMKTDSSKMELLNLFSEEGLAKLLKNSNLSEAEQKHMLMKIEKLQKENKRIGNNSLQNDTKTLMENYFKELENALATSGSEQQLKELQTMMGKNNMNLSLHKPSIEKENPTTKKIREVLGTNKSTFLEENLNSYSFYGLTKKQKVLEELAVANRKDGEKLLIDYYQVTDKEFQMLKELPASKKIGSGHQAIYIKEYELPVTIQDHLKSGAASAKFRGITSTYIRDNGTRANQFLRGAKGARESFYAINPGWYGERGTSGDTYVDSRNKFIYLPLGAISFADKVISHDPGYPKGSHAQGSIGEPDMSLEKFKIADPKICNLGIRGVLTLEFTDNTIANVNGPDLYIFEMGAIEPTHLELSKDGKTWIDIGKIEGGTAEVDIEPFCKPGETFNYIRLTDLDSNSTLPGADVDAVAAIGGALRLNLDSAVLFDTGKFQLKDSASEELQKLVTSIQKIPKARIVVEGHTDNIGDPQSNNTLSENRAKEVSAYLKKKLSDQYNFDIKGYGERQPISPNDTEENKQKNRRVEILVIPK